MLGDQLRDVLAWCASAVGPCEPVDTDVRFHGRTSVLKLKTASGFITIGLPGSAERGLDLRPRASAAWVKA